jgi:hypothetical protein
MLAKLHNLKYWYWCLSKKFHYIFDFVELEHIPRNKEKYVKESGIFTDLQYNLCSSCGCYSEYCERNKTNVDECSTPILSLNLSQSSLTQALHILEMYKNSEKLSPNEFSSSDESNSISKAKFSYWTNVVEYYKMEKYRSLMFGKRGCSDVTVLSTNMIVSNYYSWWKKYGNDVLPNTSKIVGMCCNCGRISMYCKDWKNKQICSPNLPNSEELAVIQSIQREILQLYMIFNYKSEEHEYWKDLRLSVTMELERIDFLKRLSQRETNFVASHKNAIVSYKQETIPKAEPKIVPIKKRSKYC